MADLSELLEKVLDDRIDEVLEGLENFKPCSSLEVRTMISVHSRVVFHLWERSSFGLKEFCNIGILRQIYCQTLEWMEKVNINEGIWFGGVCRFGYPAIRDRCFVTLLIVACVFREIAICDTIAKKIQEHFISARDLVSSLINHDESCLAMGLSLLQLRQFFNNHPLLDYRIINLHIFLNIDFQYEIILDWLQSDLIAVSYMCRLLEDLSKNAESVTAWRHTAEELTTFQTSSEDQRNSHSTLKFQKEVKGSWQELASGHQRDDIILKVKELAGNHVIFKELRLSRAEPSRVWIPSLVNDRKSLLLNNRKREYDEEDIFDKLYDMLVRLRLKLTSLQENDLTAFNVRKLIQLIEKFEDLVDD